MSALKKATDLMPKGDVQTFFLHILIEIFNQM
jgi:hypothetical protein